MFNYEPFVLSPLFPTAEAPIEDAGTCLVREQMQLMRWGVGVAVEWGPGPHCGQKLRPSPASAFILLEEALQHLHGVTLLPPILASSPPSPYP